MDSLLTVFTKFKGKREGGTKLSLSCNDLSNIGSDYDELDTIKHLKRHSKDSSQLPKYLSPGFSGESMDRAKSKSASDLVNTFDIQLAEIREKLAMFREQDIDFHRRIDSLNNSIGELASLTNSEASDPKSDSMLYDDDDDDEQYYSDDEEIIKNKIENVSMSFSTEVLDCIPTIKVTPYNRMSVKRRKSSNKSLSRSDPAIHETSRLASSSSVESDRHSICISDHAYFYGSGEEISTIL